MYVKLYDSMFNGTLATHGPWQAVVTFQQLLILADPEGVVDMTPEAIARRTTIPLEIITVGLAALEQPDPESRSPAEDGRRIVRLSESRSWGWRLVNYASYRAMRDETDRREYQKNWARDARARKKINGASTNVDSVDMASTTVDSDDQNRPRSTQAVSSKQKQKPHVRSNGRIAPVELDGFAAFWKAWPAHHRKAAPKDCLAKWRKGGLEAQASAIVAHVEAMKSSPEWTKNGGEFIPAPLVYLNQARYEAPMPATETEDQARARRARQGIV